MAKEEPLFLLINISSYQKTSPRRKYPEDIIWIYLGLELAQAVALPPWNLLEKQRARDFLREEYSLADFCRTNEFKVWQGVLVYYKNRTMR